MSTSLVLLLIALSFLVLAIYFLTSFNKKAANDSSLSYETSPDMKRFMISFGLFILAALATALSLLV